MSEVAVLNANYLLALLRDDYELPYDRHCMHEFVLSARGLKREHGITALDVAKRLMDFGIHPPTIYFPLVVPEALMIEPTETEPKERLDAFVEAMKTIAREAAEDPEKLKSAPHTRPVRRLDEVKAAKEPIVRHRVRRPARRVRETGGVASADLPRADRAVERADRGGAAARSRAASTSSSRTSSRSTAPPGRWTGRRSWRLPPGPYEIDEWSYEEIDPEVYGDTAVLVSRYRQTARLDGRDLSAHMHVTDIWVRREGRWQIVRRHGTLAA